MLFAKNSFLVVSLLSCQLIVFYVSGIPIDDDAVITHGLGPCENGPCAAEFGPCVMNSDCMYGNVCIEDMDTCKNMVSPCCQKNPCREAFMNRPDASCVLYDDELCNGEEGETELSGDESVESVSEFTVESVSVKMGCQLTIFTDENMEGESHVFKAEEEDVHVTLGDEEDETIKNFDDNVKSAMCECS